MENISLFPVLVVLAVDFCSVIAAVTADLIAGVIKSRREKKRITSSGFRRTVDKFARYTLSLFGLMVVDAVIIAAVICLNYYKPHHVDVVLPVFTSLGALGLTLIEVKSIFERSSEKGDLEEAASIVARLIDYIRKK